MKSNIIFIAGTDTGVGKTYVSALIVNYFLRKNYNPFYYKPFQTGCKHIFDTESDIKYIYENTDLKTDPKNSVGYCFAPAKAPYFAAKDLDIEISMDKIYRSITSLSENYNPLIVEAAGGLFVPITKDVLFVDFLQKLNAHLILVGRSGLGTQNHTLLSLEAMERRGIRPKAVLFSDAEKAGKDMIMDNMEAIKMYSGVSVDGVIKFNYNEYNTNYTEIFEKIFLDYD